MSIEAFSQFKKLNLHEKPILVVGIIKNVADSLAMDIANISKALKDFSGIHWFLIESESTDSTPQTLTTLAKDIEHFKYESLNDNLLLQSRTERLANARNAYLMYIRKKIDPEQFPYIAIADFNLLNNKLTREAVISSWERNDWDVVTANQSGRYYDIWALRHELWSPNDCWEHHQFLKKYIMFPELVNAYSIRSRMLKIPRGSEWIPVDSAFGGFAIYKSEYLMQNSLYEGKTQQNEMVCEHVPFHAYLRNAGARIYVNSSLINTHYTDHSRRMNMFFTFLRLLRYGSVNKIKRYIFRSA